MPIADLCCPVCDVTSEPKLVIGSMAICAGCGASLILDGATVRRATGADIDELDPHDLKTLTRARASVARPERRQR